MLQALVVIAGVAALVGISGLLSSLVRLYHVVIQPAAPENKAKVERRQRALRSRRSRAAAALQRLTPKSGARVETRREKLRARLAGLDLRLDEGVADLEDAKEKDRAVVEAWRAEHPFAFRRAIASSVAAALWLLLAYLTLMGAVTVVVANQLFR